MQTFSQLGPDYKSKTVVIVPYEEQVGDIAFQTYARELEGELRDVGFTVGDLATASHVDYAVLMYYGMDTGREVARSYAIPQWGVTGYGSSNTFGTLNTFGNFGTYSGTTTYNPTYGITGWSTGVRSETVFTGGVIIRMYDVTGQPPKAPPEVFNATVTTSGSCKAIAAVMPALLHAAFDEFPGEASRTKEVEVSLPEGQDC